MTLRLHHDSRPRAANRAHARRRALAGRPRAARGVLPGCRNSLHQRSTRPLSYGTPRALVSLNFNVREAMARLALLRVATALAAPWRLLKSVVPRLWATVAGNRSHDERQWKVT